MTVMPASSRLLLYAGVLGAAAAILAPHHSNAGALRAHQLLVRDAPARVAVEHAGAFPVRSN